MRPFFVSQSWKLSYYNDSNSHNTLYTRAVDSSTLPDVFIMFYYNTAELFIIIIIILSYII